MNTKNKNAVEITHLTDAALDVILSVRSGDENVDAEHLTIAERFSVAEALGWEMNARTRYWCTGPSENAKTGPRSVGPDFEAMILEDQESDESWWG